MEDIISTILSILAILVPVLIAAVVIIVTAFIIWWMWRRANRQALVK
jgi:nitrogen fixation-related uncharacterized protein